MSFLRNLRDKIVEFDWEDAANPSRWVTFARNELRVSFYIVREFVRNRCLQQAASLTFTTLLSLVPLLAVAFSFFRGFAAMEDLADKAQTAIFETMLAGPLMESAERDESRTLSASEPLPPADSGPVELLATADAQPRTRDVVWTVRAYLEALEAGADPQAVREGMSALYYAKAARILPEVIRSEITQKAREAYLSAAGLQAVGGEAYSREGARHFERALNRLDDGDVQAALEASREAEERGYSAVRTRRVMARAHTRRARDLAHEGYLQQSCGEWRKVLLHYGDAIVAGGLGNADWRDLRDVMEAHDEAVRTLGERLFELGRLEANLHREPSETPGPANAATTPSPDGSLDLAVLHLTEAVSLLEHSSDAHYLLADVLWQAGRLEEAREEYKVAFDKSSERAARGLSLAVVDYIRLFIDKVGRAEIGILGILFLLVTATSLLSTIEQTLNHIWKVTEHRPLWIKFTSFCTLIWLGPALIGASIWARERLAVYIESTFGGVPAVGKAVGLLSIVGRHVLPFITVWLILVALYKFLPHTQVRFSSVAWGAFFGAALLQAARPLFAMYVVSAVKYQKIYGSLGIVPIFLLWLWLMWLIVLLGAEIAFTLQHLDLLRFRDKLSRLSSNFIDRYLAARIMMYVAREFWKTGEPVSAERLAEIMKITPEEAQDAAGRLVRLGYLIRVGETSDEYHPARDLSRLRLSEVLSITDRFRDDSRSVLPEDRPYEEKLEAAFRSAIAAQEEALAGATFRDLLLTSEAEEPPEEDAASEAEGEGELGT